MKTTLTLTALGLSIAASAHGPDGFTLSAEGPGSAHGPIGQLGDGQNRIGGGHPQGTYYLKDGRVSDKSDRGCILTPPTTQWQCDEGAHRKLILPSRLSSNHTDDAAADDGFAVDCHGKFTHSGSTQFYACPVNDNGEWNVYSKPVANQKKCVEISLTTHGKALPSGCSSADKSPSPASSAASVVIHGTTAPSTPTSCPADLNGDFEFPHLIVPVDELSPDAARGNSLNGTIAPGVCSIFNFDIRPEHKGKQCSAIFLLPEHDKLETSAYSMEGSGKLYFYELHDAATHETTWNNKAKGEPFPVGPVDIKPGKKMALKQEACRPGEKFGIQVCSDGDLSLNFFQDYNPEPIGMYIRVC